MTTTLDIRDRDFQRIDDVIAIRFEVDAKDADLIVTPEQLERLRGLFKLQAPLATIAEGENIRWWGTTIRTDA